MFKISDTGDAIRIGFTETKYFWWQYTTTNIYKRYILYNCYDIPIAYRVKTIENAVKKTLIIMNK